MRTKLFCCVAVVIGMLTTFALGVVARERLPEAYADNIFCWNSDVFGDPTDNTVVLSKITLVGTGGIKINASHMSHDRFKVEVDGSAVAANSGVSSSAPGGSVGAVDRAAAFRVADDFNAAVDSTYFVTRTSTCTLPSAVGAAGKEILVWNVCAPEGVVTYKTTQGQSISGALSGAVSNPTVYKLERFMSDGGNWFRE